MIDQTWYDTLCSQSWPFVCKFPKDGFNAAGYTEDVTCDAGSAVKDCANGCTAAMVGDGTCNEECSNEACGYDSGDCDCSPGCSPNMKGNGICDTACSNSACNHDDSDCDCSPGCPTYWNGDGECDSVCDNADCNNDGGDCKSFLQTEQRKSDTSI